MPRWRIDRRTFLLGSGAALSLGPALASCGGAEATPLAPEPEPNDGATPFALDVALLPASAAFTRGVQAGAMDETSATLWSHTTDAAAKTLFVWRERASGERLLAHQSEVTPTDGFLRTKVNGLGPGHYRFAFTETASGEPNARSVIGRFRTAFRSDDNRPLTIAGLTCTSLRYAPFTALDQTAAEELDLICHLGDMSYNDGARTLDEYRARWAATLSQPGYIAAYTAAGLYATWDDHEVDNDYDPERMALEDPDKLAAAKSAFFETVAIDALENQRLWRSHRWGLTAEIFIVDSRSERKPSTRETEDAEYLSRAQMDWLKQALVASPCRFKIVLNSVPMTDLPEVWTFAAFDRWLGYRAQRDELLSHLEAHDVKGIVFLSGDFHVGFIGRLARTGFAQRYWEIAVGPTANGPNPLAVWAETGELPPEEVFPADQFPYYSGSHMATTVLTFDPFAGTVRARFVDARPMMEGQVLFDQILPVDG